MTTRASACPHDCPSTCALEVEVLEGGRIGAVRGAAANPYTAGVICAKVARYAERIHHADRLLHPLLRTGPKGSGQFRRIGWDEALDRITDQFTTLTARHGSQSIWPYDFAGTMGLVQRGSIRRLRHALGYTRQLDTICSTIASAGWLAGAGVFRGPDPREMAEADLIIVWGGNPVATQVNVMTHIARARKTRGARLIVIDPYRTGTAQAADWHLPLRPGTDAALACAVMHVAFRDGYADRAYMARYADDPAALEAHLRPRSPAWAAAITGLAEAEIEAFAREYCATERAFIRIGYGFTRARNGAANMHAVSCLPTVTGKWAHPGAGAFWSDKGLYHFNTRLIEAADLLDPAIRQIDMSRIGAALTGDRADLGDGPPIHALFVQNTNPAAVAPNSNLVRRGFLRDDLFTLVHEQFLTDTARYADLVLPATMFLEHDDLYQAGGHSHFQVGPKLVAPAGECWSNHDLIQALGTRLGATHRAFSMTAMELVDATLTASGWPDAATVIEKRWVDAAVDFRAAHFLDGFGHQDGKFHFAADWAALGPHAAGMPRLPDFHDVIVTPNTAHPWRLVTAPARQFLNTSFTESETGRKREQRPAAMIHPEDAARLGLADGARVTLGNALGTVTLHARLFDGLQPGVIVVESVWPNDAFEGGIGINALVSDAPAPPAGGAVFHDTAIWARAAEATQAIAAE